MIKINKSSWHYQFLLRDCSGWPPENLCPYMRKLLFQSVTKFALICLAVLIASLVLFGLLSPAITMFGFYIGNGWSFPDYLPHISYMDSFGLMLGYWLFALWGGTMPGVQELPVLSIVHDYSFTGLIAWVFEACPGSGAVWAALLIIASAFIIIGLFVVAKDSTIATIRTTDWSGPLRRRLESHPDSFITLCYKYYKAKHDKFCPALVFVDKVEDKS